MRCKIKLITTCMSNTEHTQEQQPQHNTWEYITVRCFEMRIYFDEDKEQYTSLGSGIRGAKLEIPLSLDPDIPVPVGDVWWQLVWSERKKHYTYMYKHLNELGNEGWEVVAVTPPWNSSGGAHTGTHHHYFDILLK